jgi:AraC family transcriptional regulator of adaptative response/methylated-DNA-[protein]-cysteine methyltransferase
MMNTALSIDRMHEDSLNEDRAWEQLQARNRDARFFYGVATTGVFCRVGCGSRPPLRSNTRFFANASEARAAGFRACLRCKPEGAEVESPVKRMCAYLEQKLDRPARLEELGKLVGLSPFTAQKIFKQAMSVSPAQYQRAMRANAFRNHLQREGNDVTTAIYDAGYGSSSRAYEKSPLGMTPGRFLVGGRGETIRYATAECSWTSSDVLGWIVIGSTERGICWLALADTKEEAEATLREEFPAATIAEDAALTASVKAIIQTVVKPGLKTTADLPLDLRGTAFQLRVWKALQEIPAGETRTYSQLASEMGIPSSTRAVARACATNRVSVLVPCHRVIGVSGSLTGYRWGVERKRRLLNAEGVRR